MGRETNLVVTAAHCFCDLLWEDCDSPGAYDVTNYQDRNECIRSPKPGHHIVRIGLINNKQNFNLVVSLL